MPSFTTDSSNQACTNYLPEKNGKKINVFGKTEIKPEVNYTAQRIALPKGTLYPIGITPSKFPNLING